MVDSIVSFNFDTIYIHFICLSQRTRRNHRRRHDHEARVRRLLRSHERESADGGPGLVYGTTGRVEHQRACERRSCGARSTGWMGAARIAGYVVVIYTPVSELALKNKQTQQIKKGPASADLLQALTSYDLRALTFGRSAFVPLEGINVHVARGGYTGEDGFEVSLPSTAF